MEVSEINVSNLDKIKNRYDAEYYQKKYLKIDEKIKNIGETNLSKIDAVLDCSAFYPSITGNYNFAGEGVPFLRVNEIQKGQVILTESTAFLPQEIIDDNLSTIAKGYPGDLIIAKGGNTLAKVGLIGNEYKYYALSRDIILVRTNSLRKYNRYFLWQFFHSDYGQSLLWRTASQTGQPHLTLPSLNEINLPKFNILFEENTEKLYLKSLELHKKSKQTYSQAENLLLTEIGLQDFKPSNEAVNIKSFSDSFSTSGRLDAEYYQPKFDDYLGLINKYKGGANIIDNICNVKIKNFRPTEDKTYNYIELSNIGKSGEVNGCTIDVGENLPSRARRKVNTGDVIISSIEGSLESCALIPSYYDNALCSTGFYVLNSKQINSETLLVLFKSKLMQNILKQNCSGTILTAINKDEFVNVLLPIIDEEVQTKIAELVKESFTLKQQSEHLLEVAKRAVEIAIEEDETVAMDYIEKQTQEIA